MNKNWYYNEIPLGGINLISLTDGSYLLDRGQTKNYGFPITCEATENCLQKYCKTIDNFDEKIESVIFSIVLRNRYNEDKEYKLKLPLNMNDNYEWIESDIDHDFYLFQAVLIADDTLIKEKDKVPLPEWLSEILEKESNENIKL